MEIFNLFFFLQSITFTYNAREFKTVLDTEQVT